jgi:3-hydroxyisobutyrate dehydrogenase-like beta-hydroxyacid dehydrogenase
MSVSQESLAVGMVGIGNMGMPIARRIRAAGFEVSAFARRPEVVDEARSFGVRPADTPAEVAAANDVVIVNVFSDDQVREIALGPGGLMAHMRPGSILVNHTTGRPATAEYLASMAVERGFAMLDCAMSGGPLDIAAGQLTLLVGGDPGALERVRPLLAAYSSPILYVGMPGDAQKVKLLNNTLFGAQVALVVQIEKSAQQLGMDPALVLPAIRECSGDSYALGAALGLGSAAGLLEAAKRYIQKDVAVCAEIAAELDVDLGSALSVAQEV